MSLPLSKPFHVQLPQPDVLNFPVENRDLAQDFNFAAEFFKFAPKLQCLAFDGKRIEGSSDEAEGAHLGDWRVTDEWVEAINEYSVPDGLTAELFGSDYWGGDAAASGQVFRNNAEVVSYYEGKGEDPWDWHNDWVAGFNNFDKGERKTSYFEGEGVARGVGNADYVAEAHEWNHLEKKKYLGLMSLLNDYDNAGPKEESLNADVAQEAFYIGDLLDTLDFSWEEVNSLLQSDKFKDQSYYQIVMNAIDPNRRNNSYKALDESRGEHIQVLAAMIEARNRGFGAMEKIFGSVDQTWNDPAVQASIMSWLGPRTQTMGLSHGINSFRLFYQMQNQFMKMMTLFYEDRPDRVDSAAMLDKYAFWQFVKDLGVEFYFGENRDPDGDDIITKGSIFEYIERDLGIDFDSDDDKAKAIRKFLCSETDVPNFSFKTKPGDINISECLPGDENEGHRQELSGVANKVKAYKWLLEQWFGATKVKSGYNGMPKADVLAPEYDLNDGDDYEWESVGCWDVKVTPAITQSNGARSYGWGKVFGAFHNNVEHSHGHAFWANDGNGERWIEDNTAEWREIYTLLRGKYPGLAYISEQAPEGGPRKNTVQYQFRGLGRNARYGISGNREVYANSGAVFAEGNLARFGEIRDMTKIEVWETLENQEKINFDRAMKKYRRKKEKRDEDAIDNARYEAAQRKKGRQEKQLQKKSLMERIAKSRQRQKELLNKLAQRKGRQGSAARRAAKPKKG
ncbi:hypothetical protein ACFL31_00060 [Candidatus Margulisiibacteriota bacterium]